MWQNENTKTVFCIGKDNIIFHTIIFPALLMATHEPYVLPYSVTATEFIMFGDQPFSKSKGVGVSAKEALEIAPADCWRYYLIINRPETKDMDFIDPTRRIQNVGGKAYSTMYPMSSKLQEGPLWYQGLKGLFDEIQL